jgi:hypothetical protein
LTILIVTAVEASSIRIGLWALNPNDASTLERRVKQPPLLVTETSTSD